MGKKLFSILAAVLLVSCCASAQLLYRVSGNGLKSPSYIFGTHHLAPLSVVDSIPALRTAMEETSAVAGEIDMTAINQMEMAMKLQKYMAAPADSSLSAVLGREAFDKAAAKFNTLTGADLRMLDKMRPIVASTLISMTMMMKEMPGFNATEQLDAWFQQEAKNSGKGVVALETPEMQAEILYTSTPIAVQAKNLLEALDDPEKQLKQVEDVNRYYRTGELDKLLEMTLQEETDAESKAFMDALLTRRNERWAKQLPEMMAKEPMLVAVGALHLPGAHGVLQLLRDAGYTVTPVN